MPRLEPKLKHEKQRRSNRFVEVDIEERDVPMYRSYGKTRKISPRLEKVKEIALSAIVAFHLIYILLIGALIAFVIVRFSNVLTFFLSVPICIATAIILTRTPRKRISFLRKLKRFCKKNGYTLTFNRNFFSAFLWDRSNGTDFTLKTRTHTYLVKFATATKRNSDFVFNSKTEMLYRKLRLNNKFTVAFNLKPKITKLPISFPDTEFVENTTTVILLNPVPRDISIKEKDGATVATGDGENRFGYVIHSGTGFISAVERRESNNDFKF